MKTRNSIIRVLMTIFILTAFSSNAHSQILKKLKQKAEKAAQRTVERRVEKETQEKTDEVLDSILEPGKKGEKAPTQEPLPPIIGGQETRKGGSSPNGTGQSRDPLTTDPESIAIYSKFDYVPGDQIMFYDDFTTDFIGDFPSKWNTNGGGEVVTINESPEKWLELVPGYNLYFIPDVPKLPEEYTIEFDVMAVGLTKKTSSTATLRIDLSDDNKFKEGTNFVHAQLPFCQYSAIGITIANHINNKREIYSVVRADLRDEVLDRPHISVAVNQQRFRLWVNEEKHIDIPRIVPEGAVLTTLKFHMNNFKDGEERLLITNLKVAEGGVDLRRQLISVGKVSTNGILFDPGSDQIKPQSLGIIRQISQVLLQEEAMDLNIIGHTDADGDAGSNIQLSKDRAEAVKNALVQVYGIDTSRLTTEGMGEADPVGDNSTTEGKAQNRRVEFIKT
ncbi:OmpA family protein [Sediminicola arcticus]|jgi:OOP family OmpA-OmpF porin|uniref:OmpA family protein n=1 Tax=Sediminicola arcticus TaxID=1574308 RepID=A0ABV2SWB9_9FLAO